MGEPLLETLHGILSIAAKGGAFEGTSFGGELHAFHVLESTWKPRTRNKYDESCPFLYETSLCAS